MVYLFKSIGKFTDYSIRNKKINQKIYQHLSVNNYNYFYKKYSSIFFFLLPKLSEECLNFKKSFKYSLSNTAQKIRLKPGYKIFFIFLRQNWLSYMCPFYFRQVRLTRVIFLFSQNHIMWQNTNIVKKTPRNIYSDPSKRLANWKYIT